MKELFQSIIDVDYLSLLWWGLFCGVGLSLLSLLLQLKPLDLAAAARTTQCGLEGAGVCAGLHLLICALDPTKLIEIVKADGAHVALEAGQKFKMDPLHAIHLGAGGIATILIAIVGLNYSCKHSASGQAAH